MGNKFILSSCVQRLLTTQISLEEKTSTKSNCFLLAQVQKWQGPIENYLPASTGSIQKGSLCDTKLGTSSQHLNQKFQAQMPSEVQELQKNMNRPFCGTTEKLFIFKKYVGSYAIEILAHCKVSLRGRNYHYSNREGREAGEGKQLVRGHMPNQLSQILNPGSWVTASLVLL